MKPVNTIGVKINNEKDTNMYIDNDKEKNVNSENKSDIELNLSNEFKKIESINKLNHTQIKPQFDFYKDFEMRENIEKTIIQNNPNQYNSNEVDELNMMLNSFPIINDNIRANIQLSVEIYKKINNFDINYVHNCIDEKTKK